MSDFGDDEPEDAWHPDDAIHELLDNLCRRCTLLGEPRQLPADATHAQRIAELAERLDRISVRDLTDHDRARVIGIDRDLTHVHRRLITGQISSQHG